MKVKDAIAKIEQDGWYLKRTKSSHRQFKHPNKSGTVTISGKLSKEVPIGTSKKHSETSTNRRGLG